MGLWFSTLLRPLRATEEEQQLPLEQATVPAIPVQPEPAATEEEKNLFLERAQVVTLPLMEVEHLNEAVDIFFDAVQNPRLLQELARGSASQMDVHRAVRHYIVRERQTKERMPCAIALHLIGDTLSACEAYSKAIGCYTVALLLYEREFLKLQTEVRQAMEKERPTTDLVLLAMDVANKHSTCCSNVSFCFTAQERYEDAIIAAQRGLALTCAPEVTRLGCLQRIALAYGGKKDYTAAIDACEKVLLHIKEEIPDDDHTVKAVVDAGAMANRLIAEYRGCIETTPAQTSL